MTHADVVILGGGIIGCALAEELARRGRRVVVLERGRIGSEASTAAPGILSAQMDLSRPGPFFELCQASRRLYPQWVKGVERRSRRTVGYQTSGILYLAFTRREAQVMDRRARWQRRAGLRVERWSSAEIRRREPAMDGRFLCGYAFPAEAQVNTQRLMRSLGASCRAAKVRLLERTPVRRIHVRGRAVRGVTTGRGTIAAPTVVDCLGSWADLSGKAPVRLPVEPVRGQILAFLGPKRMIRRAVMSTRAYVVQRPDGQLLVGSTLERAGFDKSLTVDGMHAILCGIRHMSSMLNRCSLLGAWTGLRPFARDGLPILGKTRVDGLYAATGHFRHGILLAPITARLMTQLILGERPSSDLAPFSPTRFR